MPRQSLESSRKKAEQQSRINQTDSLGSAKTDFFNEDELNTVDLLVGEFIKKVKDNLQLHDMIVTGAIADITVQKVENGIDLLCNPWLIYQDKGVNGTKNRSRNNGKGYTNKRPPVQMFIDWIKARNIQARHQETLQHGKDYKEKQTFTDNDKEIEQLAYAMREKVYQQGMAAKNVYSNDLPEFINKVAQNVADFTVKEILNGL